MRIQAEDILKLDEILKPCVELTSLSLTLSTGDLCYALGQRVANDLSLLIGHHPTLKRLVLHNFEDLLVDYWDIYRLPISLETLVLKNSVLTCVDLEYGTDASTISHIQNLTISNYSWHMSEIEGYLKFIESQAETLVSLHIHLFLCDYLPHVHSLKHMAKCLAKFNKLQRFTYHMENVGDELDVQNLYDMLEILLDVMPLIESLKSYNLIRSSGSCLYDRDILQSLQLAMKKICIGRKGLLDFATVNFNECQEFQDGIFIGEYDDLLEVMGYQCHSSDDYGCERDMGEDFQDDNPIREYEEVWEVVGNQCQLPDDYDCERDMDDIPISKYEAAFILANMKTHCEVVAGGLSVPFAS